MYVIIHSSPQRAVALIHCRDVVRIVGRVTLSGLCKRERREDGASIVLLNRATLRGVAEVD